jgi:hypothetical protein
MTKFGKRASMLLGASALAIAVAAAPSPSKAFNVMDWNWHLNVHEDVFKFVLIDIFLNPTGLVLVENIQVHVGNATAISHVFDIDNNQPVDAGGTGTATATLDLGEIDWTMTRVGNTTTLNVDHTFDATQDGVVGYTGDTGIQFQHTGPGNFNEGGGFLLGSVELEFEVEVDPTGSFDALTELPEVVSTAVAVANNSSIESNVAIELHEGQFAWGDGAPPVEALLHFDTGNSHTDLLLSALVGIQFGTMQKGLVYSESLVGNILNATVDSSATSVVNNKTITLDARTNSDALLMADITQFGYMDAVAYSSVGNVSLNNYHSLGLLDRPIVSSVATAVGNNLNIVVSGP